MSTLVKRFLKHLRFLYCLFDGWFEAVKNVCCLCLCSALSSLTLMIVYYTDVALYKAEYFPLRDLDIANI